MSTDEHMKEREVDVSVWVINREQLDQELDKVVTFVTGWSKEDDEHKGP